MCVSCVVLRWIAQRSPRSPCWQPGAGTRCLVLSAEGGVLKRQALAVLLPRLLVHVLLLYSLPPILMMLLFSKSFSNRLGQKVKLLLYVLFRGCQIW